MNHKKITVKLCTLNMISQTRLLNNIKICIEYLKVLNFLDESF